MGWTSYPVYGDVNRKKECDRVYTGENDTTEWIVLKSTMVGSVYYAAVMRIDKETRKSRVFAGICLTRVEKGEFWYKDMDESCGPFENKCPNSILKLLSDTPYEFAKEWRKRCREYNSKPKLGKLPIGTTIEFTRGGETIQATKMSPAYQFKTPWWTVTGADYIKKNHIPEDFRVVE